MDNQPNSLRQRLIKITLVFALVFSIFLFVSWLLNTSYISFRAPEGLQESTKYELVNQQNKEVIVFESNETSFKKRVPKASYEIKVLSDDESYFQVLKTKPFLQTSEVEFSLSAERKREFIGDNPESCIYYGGTQAISYSCKNEISYMASHVPATSDTPTYTNSFGGDVEHLLAGGLVGWQGKKILYAQGFNDLESTEQHGLFFEINDSLDILSGLELDDIDTNETNAMRRYKDGFLVYGKDFDQLRYYPSLSKQFQTIKIGYPDDKKLQASTVDVFENKIAAVYTNTEAAEKVDEDSGDPAPGKTAVRIYDSENIKEFTFKEGFSSVKLCSATYLCYLNADNLSIYDISRNKQELLFEVTGVKSAFPINGKVIIEREKEILEVDPKSQKGYVQYSLGDYNSCGTSPTETSGYTVCIINNKNTQNLLYVDSSTEDTDSIDKKVLSLLKQPFVSNVSAYKSFLYVSPNIGGLIPDPSSGQFIYDPVIKAEAANTLNRSIEEIGLDTSKFTIINTSQ